MTLNRGAGLRLFAEGLAIANTRGVPPARNTFTSSMLSAPHIMPVGNGQRLQR
jgi:hypothetical protein